MPVGEYGFGEYEDVITQLQLPMLATHLRIRNTLGIVLARYTLINCLSTFYLRRGIMPRLEEFRLIFYPDAVAVVGASEDPRKLGYHCLTSLVKGGFKGENIPDQSKIL